MKNEALKIGFENHSFSLHVNPKLLDSLVAALGRTADEIHMKDEAREIGF